MIIYFLLRFGGFLRVPWEYLRSWLSSTKDMEKEFSERGWERYSARINYSPGSPPFFQQTQAERFNTSKEAVSWLHTKRSLLETDGFEVASETITDMITGAEIRF